MRKPWENHFDYTFFRPYIGWTARTCYSRIDVKGAENVPDPEKASVLFAANHCCTMMDSLVILHTQKKPVAFVARADVFKKPFIARLLSNMRILPIYRRQRDGADSQEKNRQVFDNVVECISKGTPLVIHPEGTHRPRRSLLPLKKGVFRIALQAAAEHPERPVYVVPTGLEYDDYFSLQKPVTVSFGEPMLIRPAEASEEHLQELADDLRSRLSSLITCFPDDGNLEAREKEFEESKRRHYGPLAWFSAIVALPLFVLFGFLSFPILLLSAILTGKLKDRAWHNTARFSSRLVLTPFLVAGAAVAGIARLPWYGTILLILLTLYSHPIFYRIFAFYKELIGNGKN